ncbi:hypothetical protein V5799_007467, partial [Amblyomma americanum]
MDLDQKEKTGTPVAEATSNSSQKSKRRSKKEHQKPSRKKRKKTASVNLSDVSQRSPSHLNNTRQESSAPKESADTDKGIPVSVESSSCLPIQLDDTACQTELNQELLLPAKSSTPCSTVLTSGAVSTALSGPTSYCRSSVSFDDSVHVPSLSCVSTDAFNPDDHHSQSRGKVHADDETEEPLTTAAFRPTRQAAPPGVVDSGHGQIFWLHETVPNAVGKADDLSANLPPDSKDTKPTSLFKTGAATSMSYRRMSYKGSFRAMRTGRDAEFLLIAVAIDVLFVLLLIVVGLDFALVSRDKQTDIKDKAYDFCCTKEAAELVDVIDTTANPCDDLHA